MVRRTIATIGYEGASLDDFIATLKESRIDTLIDVREIALSRKKGFSKSALSEAVAEHGIRYVHLRGLGDPKEGRDAARAGDITRFLRIFRQHMRSAIARTELATAISLAQSARICLMCFEADHEFCHRRIVANHLAADTGLKVTPLKVAAGKQRLAA